MMERVGRCLYRREMWQKFLPRRNRERKKCILPMREREGFHLEEFLLKRNRGREMKKCVLPMREERVSFGRVSSKEKQKEESHPHT